MGVLPGTFCILKKRKKKNLKLKIKTLVLQERCQISESMNILMEKNSKFSGGTLKFHSKSWTSEQVLVFNNSKCSDAIQNFSIQTKNEESLPYNYSTNKVQRLILQRLRQPDFIWSKHLNFWDNLQTFYDTSKIYPFF